MFHLSRQVELWGLTLSGLIVCLFILRTALEDKTLREELDGYQTYTRQVRYRLLPWIWWQECHHSPLRDRRSHHV